MLNIDALQIDARPRRAEKAASASDTRTSGAGGLAPRPRTVADTGLSESLLQELLAKYLHDAGTLWRWATTRRRACHPRDIVGMALDHAWYLGQTSVTPELIERAWNNYFVVPGSTPG
jgi:hypothetical protein